MGWGTGSAISADWQAASGDGLVEKKDWASRLSLEDKRECIESGHGKLSIQRQCELIGLSRASDYRSTPVVGETVENLELMRRIDEEYTRHPFYGSRKMRDWLRGQGYEVNRKRVQRLMRKMKLVSVAPKPNSSRPVSAHKVYPYLLQGLRIGQPDQVWCADITYIRMAHGFVYLMVVMDWYSRYVLTWEISVTMEEAFRVSALESALRRHGHPQIFNTDQGAQFTGEAFTGVLRDADVAISMDGKGRAMDNTMVERLWRSVKYEEVYLKDYEGVGELVEALKQYFTFYNTERPHQGHGGLTPAEVYYGSFHLMLAT
uniref:Putative transposase n=1 Tax=Candidatus Kentrum sp. TC TaxID=2126339 RepID=A0A450ZJW8_9GAMM|nr:MAG: putative transposase [Candidatus Kentron sp. TC]